MSHQPSHARRFYTGKIIVWLISLVMIGFLALPLIALTLRGITVGNWQDLLDDGVLDAIYLSLTTTAQTVIITLLLGTPLAYVMARWKFPGKRVVNLLIELPIVLPPAVAGLALLLTFGRRGLLGPALSILNISLPFTTTAVIFAQTFVAAPFYIHAAILGFQNIPDELEDAARVDGASEPGVFRYITLPLARRSMAAGLILSWARAIGEFGATILFAGSLQGTTQTMPLLVYSVLERDINAAVLTGLLLILMALAALVIAQWLYPMTENLNT